MNSRPSLARAQLDLALAVAAATAAASGGNGTSVSSGRGDVNVPLDGGRSLEIKRLCVGLFFCLAGVVVSARGLRLWKYTVVCFGVLVGCSLGAALAVNLASAVAGLSTDCDALQGLNSATEQARSATSSIVKASQEASAGENAADAGSSSDGWGSTAAINDCDAVQGIVLVGALLGSMAFTTLFVRM
eukprot:COSAG05_NODE_575_length_8585_cov_4.618666_2_plen_188_part_00